MYNSTIKEDGLTSWLKFYNLTNNKETLDYADTVKAIVLINFTMEEFIMKREELEELIDKGSIDRDVIDKSESYIEKNIIYMPAGLNIHFHDKKGSEYNQYIYNVCYSILMENINIYFNGILKELDKEQRDNIKKSRLINERYSLIIDRIMKLLYLFNISNTKNTGFNKIYRYIGYSIKNEGIMLKSLVKEMLDVLLEKSYIDMDFDGNYSIMSEERKDIRRQTVYELKYMDDLEVEKIMKEITKECFSEFIAELGEISTTVDVAGEKLNKGFSNLNIKLDLYLGNDKSTKKGYYLLNTRQYDNIIYWYSNQSSDFHNKMKWFIAYSKSVDFYIDRWKNQRDKVKFLKHEHENRMLILNEIKMDILSSFEHGSLIYLGKDKRIANLGNCKSIFSYLIKELESKNKYI